MTWFIWLEGTPLAQAISRSLWLYPGLEILHLIGLALLVGAAALFDLRLLGLSRRLPVGLAAKHLLPWAHVGLGLAAASGLLLFASAASELITSPVFLIKMGLLGVAGLNALAFHTGPFRTVRHWDQDAPTPARAKIAATISLVVWFGVVATGRLIAYV